MNANPLNLPIGLQLYTVGQEMDSDPAGTLRAVAAAGYKQVELSPLAKTSAKDLKKMLDDAGLKNPSGHYMLPDLIGGLQEKLDFAHQFGQEFMVVTVPWVADPSRFKPDPQLGQFALFVAIINGLTLDDWKWNAEQFNKVGEQVKQAGLQLAYHNHNFEWKSYGGVTGYDEFLRLTDSGLVKGRDRVWPSFRRGSECADSCVLCRTGAAFHGDAGSGSHQSGLRVHKEFEVVRRGRDRMSNGYFGAIAVLLLFASVSSGQADQTANAEKQKAANGQQKDAPKKEDTGDLICRNDGRRTYRQRSGRTRAENFRPHVRILSRQ